MQAVLLQTRAVTWKMAALLTCKLSRARVQTCSRSSATASHNCPHPLIRLVVVLILTVVDTLEQTIYRITSSLRGWIYHIAAIVITMAPTLKKKVAVVNHGEYLFLVEVPP